MSEAIQLYDTEGRRLYLTSAERDAFLDAATQADPTPWARNSRTLLPECGRDTSARTSRNVSLKQLILRECRLLANIFYRVQGKQMSKSETILPWSFHKGRGWLTHYEQMMRWYYRMRNSDTKEDIADFLFTFFQSCFHLRDWLPLTSEVTKEDLDKLFSANIELRICRDICNVTKHFSLSRPSLEFELSIVQESCNPDNPYHRDCWFGGDAKLIVVTDQKNYDALALAYICLTIWQNFLFEKGLIPRPYQSGIFL